MEQNGTAKKSAPSFELVDNIAQAIINNWNVLTHDQ
jgi:hypothetical protein